MYRIPVLIGSNREGRNTPRLARWIHRVLGERGDVESELIDLQELDLPLLRERLRFLEEPPEALVEFGRRMEECDALVVASPEYNKGCPAVLKNAIDALGAELRRKPIGIACHSVGAFGGQVVLQAIRPMFMNLGAIPIPAFMTIPRISTAVDLDGSLLDEENEGRAERFVDELVWYAGALKAAREA